MRNELTRNNVAMLLILGLVATACASPTGSDTQLDDPIGAEDNWPNVGGDPGCMRYSRLDDIHRGNVHQLEVAWTWHTGELDRKRQKTIECTPIVIDGVMYVSTGHLRVAALNAATGEELWSFDPRAEFPCEYPLASGGVNRGVAHWSDGRANGERRILHGASDGRLFSLDARTGRPDPAFGDGGVKDLREDLEGDLSRLPYGPTSAPVVFEDLVVLGFSCGEGPGRAAPGDIRAFDVRTGAARWRFHTVPRPGQHGHETWEGDSWQNRGGANAWGGLSVDPERGLIFAGLGSAAFDFYGGDRKGQNLFANSVLCLDASSGERRWHFQTLHHDLWDHDLPIHPHLVPLTRGGQIIDAAVQVTKTGYAFVFDRESGEPLFDIVEQPVPASTVPGESAWPTQPVPVAPPPFSPTAFSANDVTDLSEAKRDEALRRLSELDHGAAFLPPSLRGTVVTPGFHGGATWSGASFDPERSFLFVNSNHVPNVLQIVPAPEGAKYPYAITGYHKFLDDEGYPAVKPPWGQLTALDLQHGTIAWQITLGEHPALTSRGIPPTGTENFGGTIVTRGGLVFIGATKDERFRAFDVETGEVLFEAPLPAGGYATPSTYRADGRQFVVIAAGGAGKPGTRAGDAFVAFALPEGGTP